MGEDGYDICLYTPEMMPQVVDLMAHLWAEDPRARQAYFRWKYVDNPCTEGPLGIVALSRGGVVGFRGYFAARYEIPDRTRDLIVLCAGDTCVHPDHRRMGLSVTMGNLAMEASSSILFLIAFVIAYSRIHRGELVPFPSGRDSHAYPCPECGKPLDWRPLERKPWCGNCRKLL